MKTKLLVLLMLASGALMAGTHVVIGVGVGIGVGGPAYYPPVPAPVVAYAPPCPGPGYYWVPGYWYTVGHRSLWRAGYWAPRAHYRVAPRFYRHDEFRERRFYRDYDRRHRDRDGYRYRGR